MQDLLPREERTRWILERAALLSDGGAAPVSGLVLPTGKFFPDPFDGTAAAVGRLLARVVKLAGLSGLTIASNVMTANDEAGASCSTGGCGPTVSAGTATRRVEQHGSDWTLNLDVGEIGQPVVLTTALVRGVSHIFMSEADLYADLDPREAEAATDLCGCLLGFGALLCNGSYIYKKG
jgi:hypothetical protein